MKTIGYVCLSNPFVDRKAWSGIVYKMREAIENAGFNLIWIPYSDDTLEAKCITQYLRLYGKLRGGKYIGGIHYEPLVRAYARTIDMNLIKQCDYLFFPGGAQLSLYLKTDIPTLYYADASAHIMQDYYWIGMSQSSLNGAKSLETRSAQHAAVNMRSSEWAIKSVINDSKCNPERSFVLELGPNIDMKDVIVNKPYESGQLHILFSGVDWTRKGGPVAVKTAELLIQKGLDVILTVVGPKECPSECKKEFVNYIGFLDKNKPEQYAQYIRTYKENHMMLLPTSAECAGVVFSEASAFGIPSYTYDTGGVSSYVVDGVNGHCLPMNFGAEEFAEIIYEDVKAHRFQSYQDGALRLSHDRLTWESWSRRFMRIMSETGL